MPRYDDGDLNFIELLQNKDREERDVYCTVEPEPQSGSLLLDVVMASRQRASDCRLLQMPAEILAKIVDLVAGDSQALRHVALVNSDCRQLARASQFSTINFDYGVTSQQSILNVTIALAEARRDPSILLCVRRFTYAPLRDWVQRIHHEYFIVHSRYSHHGTDRPGPGEEAILQKHRDQYSRIRLFAAITAASMPNLETLVWKDAFIMDKATFSIITRSKARSLTLKDVTIEEAWSLGSLLNLSTWPLHTGPSCQNGRLFPRLRYLRLESSSSALYEHTALSLLASPLRTLELPHFGFEKFEGIANTIGPYQDLETLVTGELRDVEPVANLVRRHGTLQKLYVSQNYGSSEFHSGFDEFLVPALGEGDTYRRPGIDGRTENPVDHFRRRSLSDDDFREAADSPELRSFLQHQFASDRDAVWQQVHLGRMMRHAEPYSKVLPKLEWLLCRQRPMSFHRDPSTNSVEIIPLGTELDECKTYLKFAFGLSSQDDPRNNSNLPPDKVRVQFRPMSISER
ncbi:hypothetical protein ACHAPU_002386 [Fusarium lateritium]